MSTPIQSDLSSDGPSTRADIIEDPEKEKEKAQATIHSVVDDGRLDTASTFSEVQRPEDHEALQRSLRAAILASVIMSLIIVLVR